MKTRPLFLPSELVDVFDNDDSSVEVNSITIMSPNSISSWYDKQCTLGKTNLVCFAYRIDADAAIFYAYDIASGVVHEFKGNIDNAYNLVDGIRFDVWFKTYVAHGLPK